jgi:hypothetical protein
LEASEDLRHLWCGFEETREMMREIEPVTELGEFAKERNMFLLEAYFQT